MFTFKQHTVEKSEWTKNAVYFFKTEPKTIVFFAKTEPASFFANHTPLVASLGDAEKPRISPLNSSLYVWVFM